MGQSVETAFGSIEGAAEYLRLLLESVDEARVDLEAETAVSAASGLERRQQAIQLATYKLSQLKQHLTTSHRLLNDLRTIRRLLFAERQAARLETSAPPASGFVTTADVPPVRSNELSRAKADAARRHQGRVAGPRPPG